MAFQFAYSLDGDVPVAKDFPLDTAVNYNTGAGTNNVKKGDLVIQTSGLLRRAVAASAGAVIGIVEGTEFTGLIAQGQPMAAVNSSFTASAIDTTKNPNGVAKVTNDKPTAVFRVPVSQASGTITLTSAMIGSSYQIILDAAGDQTVNLNLTATPCVKILDFSKDGKTAFVTLL